MAYSHQSFRITTVIKIVLIFEPRHDKTCIWGIRTGQTQTGLYDHSIWLEAWNFGLRKKRDCTIYVAKGNTHHDQLRGYSLADLHLCFHIDSESRFSHDEAYLSLVVRKPVFGVSKQVPHKPGYSHTRCLEAWNFGFRKKRDCTIRAAKTKTLISFAVTLKLICFFVFAYAKSPFSHNEAHFEVVQHLWLLTV